MSAVAIVHKILWLPMMVASPALRATSTTTTLSATLATPTIASSALSKIAESGLLGLLHVWHRVVLRLCRWVTRVLLIHLIGEIVWLVHCRIIVRL